MERDHEIVEEYHHHVKGVMTDWLSTQAAMRAMSDEGANPMVDHAKTLLDCHIAR